MGRRGPVPLPDNVRNLRGNPGGTPQRHRLKLPPRAPSPPSWLSREAKAEWRRVVPGLDRMGVLAEVDRAVLSAYCDAWSRFVEAARLMPKDFLSSRTDREAKSPLWQIWRESATQVRELAKELYLTPTARLRSEIPEVASGQYQEPREGGEDILD